MQGEYDGVGKRIDENFFVFYFNKIGVFADNSIFKRPGPDFHAFLPARRVCRKPS